VIAYISVGSNIEPERNIPEALEELKRRVTIKRVSTFYRTAPVGKKDRPFFLNGVFEIETSLSARALKYDVLRPIETALGRVRTSDKYAPRTIDLDILLYADLVVDEPGLRIPDPDIRVRPFLAVPLLELAPDLALPDTAEPLASLESARGPAGMNPHPALTSRLRTRIGKAPFPRKKR
jgi:2-amino-4-hydroxy-6-hydroxymethyldihydropteridine diphosphokinase